MWIIVIIVLLALLALFSWLSTQFDIFAGIFNANIFTLLALISALIGAIYFWASSKSYKDYKIKDKVMKLFEDSSPSKNLPAKKEIDLSTIDLQSLVVDLQRVLTSPTPIFFKGWGNKRLELDARRVDMMNMYIQSVIATGQSFIRLKADAVISYDKIKLLAEKELNGLRQQAAESEFGLKLLDKKYENELTKLTTGTDIMILEVEEKKANIRRLNAEAKQEEEKAAAMKVNTKEARVRVALLEVATGEIKFSELPKSYQTYILITFLNADASKLSDFEIREELKEIVKQEKQAEANKKEADADSAKTDANSRKWKDDKAQKDAGL